MSRGGRITPKLTFLMPLIWLNYHSFKRLLQLFISNPFQVLTQTKLFSTSTSVIEIQITRVLGLLSIARTHLIHMVSYIQEIIQRKPPFILFYHFECTLFHPTIDFVFFVTLIVGHLYSKPWYHQGIIYTHSPSSCFFGFIRYFPSIKVWPPSSCLGSWTLLWVLQPKFSSLLISTLCIILLHAPT
jgi:hypothetical protein